MPSATTTSVWNRPQRSRSSRAGISVATIAAFACPGAATGILAVMLASQGYNKKASDHVQGPKHHPFAKEGALRLALRRFAQGNDLCTGAFRGATPHRFPSPLPHHRLRRR
jgi:hypothetical protein